MDIKLTIDSKEITVSAEPEEGGWRLSGVAGYSLIHRVNLRGGNIVELTASSGSLNAGRTLHIPFARTDSGTDFSYGGRIFTVDQSGAGSFGRRAAKKHSGVLTAPMMGVVADVLVEEEQHVAAHQPLMTVEAMKVMATIEAPFAGIVAKLYFAKGAVVPHGAPVVDVTPDESEASH